MIERVAIVSMTQAVPWAPITLGFARGLERHGVDVRCVHPGPPWFHAEIVKRWEPDAVLVMMHREVLPHLPAWRALLGDSCPMVAVCFDDPYDMATTLEAAKHFDLVLTPEQCAIRVYIDRGCVVEVIEPTVCDLWHVPPVAPLPKVWDVLSVGGNQWPPRKQFIPTLARELQARKLSYGEVAGNRRWIVGQELTDAMHRARMTFDLPRNEYTRDNPLGIPCTYLGPRVHIAAACGTPCVLICARGDAKVTYPSMVRTDTLEEGFAAILETLAKPEQAAVSADLALLQFRAKHAPEHRGAELLRILGAHLG